MAEAGYAHELLNKGRMRSATFWNPAVFESLATYNKDRTLITHLRHKADTPEASSELFVVNCHLTAGPEAGRRLRQMHEALDTIRKEQNKAKATPTPPVVVVGDFNSQGNSAVRHLLLNQEVTPEFRESGDPTERGVQGQQITSKTRKQTVGPFQDAYARAYESGPSPATLVVPLLDDKMVHQDTGAITADVTEQVRKMFGKFSSDRQVMTRPEVEQWLLTINKVLGRGSEYRSAMKRMEERGAEHMTFDDFLSVYESELKEGKFWGVEYDLGVVNGQGMAEPGSPPFEATFDYVYYTTQTLKVHSVQEVLTQAETAAVKSGSRLPNEWHPSDHLPVTVTLQFAAEEA
uniref:Endonuclease/exonuclease/phosphatase domain-containing protein n=1 Tax=Eutreptiella gymnastica TaxID=73025 RepID=A0A7S1HVZ7_9EUGL